MPPNKDQGGLDLSAPCELMQVGDRGRLKVPKAILAAVGLPTGRKARPPMTAELYEDGLVRIHVTADIQEQLDHIRDDLELKARAGDENARDELEVFKDRYRSMTMETDGRLCLTHAIEIFLEIEPGKNPPPYLVVGAKGGKIEVFNTRVRNENLRSLRKTLDLNP